MSDQAPIAAKTIDVLIVDDAVVVRRILSDVLGQDPAIRVVGTAANGRIALQKLSQVRPDVVTLDFEMPELNGVETLKGIRQTHPTLPVIMFSAVTDRAARETLEALACGASDYVTKPANVGSVLEAQQRIREQLIPRIKALCARPASTRTRRATAAVLPPSIVPSKEAGAAAEAVVIGVSTGGPHALAALLPALPADFPAPIAIVQHMPAMFTKLLSQRLNAQSKLTVLEARGGEVLAPGHVYIAPGDYHLALERRGADVVTVLTKAPPENSCRPAADVLFRTAAEAYGSRLLAVVLTGMGRDGLRGVEEVRRWRGQVLAQDEATSVVWGVPGYVVTAGLAERVLPLADMAPEIMRRCARTGQ